MGITLDDRSLVACQALRTVAPPSTYVRDPMHTMLASGGTLQVEIFALLKAVRDVIPDAWGTWRDRCSAWRTGRRGRKPPAFLFSVARKKATCKASHFVGKASGCLAVFPLIRHWVHTELRPSGMANAAARSFEAMAKMLELYMQGKRTCGRS
ncbi:MAG: hypothetical protein GY811_22005 [Myxococcales bacterium]|nr:hypothetical protein [Myxococcales bacterium]